ncbi:hypothetical protein NCCP2716_26310 [Sporosarcina sp. NCCP-2716]|uniref:phosphotransferase n=1 Tax=Sporosarcina sp. NCCP-2716 TaxID=2943679 RepID=UPI00203C827A|nr:phosphotransferase [Sporosarcina sp. NCCP-2716]GKV70133.1 hypothetical protein NCCP2716_26310 [Sporosarcina sp. NCCP-2716]
MATSMQILSRFGFDVATEQESIYPFSPVYKVQNFIVKRTQFPIENAERLMNYTTYLEKHKIPIVTPVNLTSDNPVQIEDDCYVCYPFIEGTAYKGTNQEIVQAGELLGRIHQLSTPDNEFQLDDYNVFDFYAHEVGEHMEKIQTLADRYNVRIDVDGLTKLLHRAVLRQEHLKTSDLKWVDTPYDYKANNLVYQDKPVVIDPDHATWIPRTFDLALALLLFHNEHATAPHRVFTPEEWRLFLQGYGARQTLTETEISTWEEAVLHVFLDEVMWLMAETEEDWRRPEQRDLFVSVVQLLPNLSAYPLKHENLKTP